MAAYRSALDTRTKAVGPKDWADTQTDLGDTLWELAIRTDGAEVKGKLLEDAVVAYRFALEVYTKADLPQEWARTQNNLSDAF